MKRPPQPMALVGPDNRILRTARLLSGNMFPSPSSLRLVAVATTEGDVARLRKLDVPAYTDWRMLLDNHDIQVLINLSPDANLRSDLRCRLPLDVELKEVLPGRPICDSFLTSPALAFQSSARHRLLDHIVASIPLPVIVYTPSGRVRLWNPACEQLTGVPAHTVKGRLDVGTTFYTMERPLLGQLLLQGTDTEGLRKFYGDGLDIECSKDTARVAGQFFGLKSRLKGFYQTEARLVSDRGRVLGVIEILQDLTPVFRLKEQFEHQQQQLRAIIAQLPFPLLQTSLDGKISFANQDAHELFFPQLKSGTTLRGASLFKLVPILADRFEGFSRGRSMDKPPSSFETHSWTFRILWHDSDWEVTFLVLPEQDKSWTVVWILNNLTGKEEKSRIHAALAVAGAISHELSQPLTAIVNSAHLLVGTPLENRDRLERHRNIIARESQRVFELHRKLQNISKYKLKDYLDTHIFDLDESSEMSLTIQEQKTQE